MTLISESHGTLNTFSPQARDEGPEGRTADAPPPSSLTAESAPTAAAGTRRKSGGVSGGNPTWTRAALTYFASRAIDPAVAEKAGVRQQGTWLAFPNGRSRNLGGDGPRFLQAKGKALDAWVVRPGAPDVLCCEGESDALAACSSLPASPIPFGYHKSLAVVAIPGTGYPVHRLGEKLAFYKQAFLAFDGDEAGRSYTERALDPLIDRDVRPIPLPLPDGQDLAGWLATLNPAERGEQLGNWMADWESEAPTLRQRRIVRDIAWFRSRIEYLEAELVGGAA